MFADVVYRICFHCDMHQVCVPLYRGLGECQYQWRWWGWRLGGCPPFFWWRSRRSGEKWNDSVQKLWSFTSFFFFYKLVYTNVIERLRNLKASQLRRDMPRQQRSVEAGSSLKMTSKKSVWLKWPKKSTLLQGRAKREKWWRAMKRATSENRKKNLIIIYKEIFFLSSPKLTLRLTKTFYFPYVRGELLTLRDIEKLHKKPKSDKETRLATAMVKVTFFKSTHDFLYCHKGPYMCLKWKMHFKQELTTGKHHSCFSPIVSPLMRFLCRQDELTEKNLLESGQSWIPSPAPAIRRKRERRTSWWWGRVRTSELKANAPSERNR